MKATDKISTTVHRLLDLAEEMRPDLKDRLIDGLLPGLHDYKTGQTGVILECVKTLNEALGDLHQAGEIIQNNMQDWNGTLQKVNELL